MMDSALPKPDHILAAAATRHFDHDARLPTRESTARHLGSYYTRRPPTQLHNHRPGPDPGGRASARPEVASTVSPQFSAGPTPESRASARLEVGSTSAFSFNTPATPRLRLRRLYPSQALQFSSSARQRRHLHRSTRLHFTTTSNTSDNPVSTSSTRQTCMHGRRSSPHALRAPSIQQR